MDEGSVTVAPAPLEPPLQEAPENIFQHVERSIDNGIKIGMLLEIQYKKDPETHWIASITMVCGHLLRVRYIGSEEDIWCDITKTVVRPVGWCNHFNELLDPPEGISSEDDVIELMTNMVQKNESIPNQSIASNGLTPIDRLKEGMKLEIQSELDPYNFWVATVIENIGGRLCLRYDGPNNVFKDFWLFYLDKRLQNIGYVEDMGHPYKLVKPVDSDNVQFSERDMSLYYKAALKAAETDPFPEDLLNCDVKTQVHQFEIGMKLEAVNPSNMSEICPATVTIVFNSNYFLVALDDDLKSENKVEKSLGTWLCSSSHPYIFPIGWAQTNKLRITPPKSWDQNKLFDWGEYLHSHSSISAPAKYFKKQKIASDFGFSEMMKIEAVGPLNPPFICSAYITKVTKHLLHVFVDPTKTTHLFDCSSFDIFPPGWCASHALELKTYQEPCLQNNSKIKKNEFPQSNGSEWCDKIFFNYKCYSGPFLNKHKLSQLPKSVGPGPLSLVIKEVLNMIISIAYKPAKMLKDWEQDEKPNNGQRTETLRAKLKTSTYYANIQVASKKTEVPGFCQEICAKLQACPYLFGPTEIIKEQCPENCLKVDKSKFQMAYPNDRVGRPKKSYKSTLKKKKTKKASQSLTVQAIEKRAILETGSLVKEDGESGNDTDNSPSSASYKSENGTRPNSPDSNSDVTVKKPRKKRELRTQFPRLEMKTRGAKLPNFALQMKEGHWNRKDVETMYSNTCVVPRKNYEDSESDEDSSSSNSLETRNNNRDRDISDVSDSEEPELKKLRVTPLHDPQPTDTKNISSSNNLNFRNSSNNPAKWSVNDLFNYLRRFEECKEIAEKLREEEVDGIAFIMLNFPTMREHLKMKMKPALNLCKHVAILKWAFLSKVNPCEA